MAAAGHSSPPPTSAAVLEFICLFTHDLRRKQKRWQDGRLKLHTFNNRVMVYDDRGNFVGDMHWRHDWDLGEGEEVELERGGTIVQVQELASRCEQDLSELLDKRAKAKEQRQMQAVARSPAPSALLRTAARPAVIRSIPLDHALLRHRPLNQVVATPSGHHARALVPKESPFERRQQTAESPDERAAKRRKYDAPPPSKSGYASALFGQALTLSATPMSSAPVAKRRPLRERDPSPEDEEISARSIRERPNPALREQPMAARQFNKPSDHLGINGKAMKTTPSHCDLEDDDEHTTRRKQTPSLLQRQQLRRQGESAFMEDEVIEVDSPHTAPAEKPARLSTAGEEAAKQPKARKATNGKPAVSLLTQTLKSTRTKSDRLNGVSNEEKEESGNVSKAQDRLAKLKNPKTTMSKPAAKKTIAKSSDPKKNDDPEAATFLPRNSSVPITELRIKSRKKRGLMVISDLAQTSPEQPCGGSTVLLAAVEVSKTKEFEETDYSVHSQPPSPHREMRRKATSRESKSIFQRTDPADFSEFGSQSWLAPPEIHGELGAGETGRNEEAHTGEDNSTLLENDDALRPPITQLPHAQMAIIVSRRKRKTTQRRISEELGEDDDSARISSPSLETSSGCIAHQETEDRVDDMGSVGCIEHDDFAPARQMSLDDVDAEPVEDNVNRISSSQGKVHDPYRIPSSSPEESSNVQARVTSSPVMISSNNDRAKGPTSNQGSGKRKLAVEGKGTKTAKSAAKKPMSFLRNVVLDEDEDVDTPFSFLNGADDRMDEAPIPNSDANLAASKQQRKSKKAAECKSNMHVLPDSDDVLLKKQTKPEQAKRAAKKKLKAQDPDFDLQSEEEQSLKRRGKIRKQSPRTTDLEETSLSSDREDSEDGTRFKRALKKTKVSENRPRLEKIKKGVKSRELVGFNFSALNAPFGLGKIGVPFSILSSPANESIQRKIEDHAAMEPSSDSWLEAIDERTPAAIPDVPQAIAETEKMAVDTPSPEPATQPGLATITTGGDDLSLSEDARNGTRSASPVFAAQEDAMTTREECISEQRKQQPAPLQQSVSRGTLTSLWNVDLAAEQSGDLTKSAADEGMTSTTKGPVTNSFVLPSKKPTASIQIREQGNIHHLASEKVPKGIAIEENIDTRPAVVATLPAFKMPEQQLTPALQWRPSCNTNVDTEPEVSEETEETYETSLAVVSSLPAFKRPEKKAQSVLPGQSSHTADVNLEAGPPRSDSAHTACETSTEERPSPAVRRQAQMFRMHTPARLDTAQTKAASCRRPGQPLAEAADADARNVQPTKLTSILSRSHSAGFQTAEAKTAADDSKAIRSTSAEPDIDLLVQKQKRAGLQHTVCTARRINNLTVEKHQPTTIDKSIRAYNSVKPVLNTHIVNPASRGRKAAVKSDAKGPVPRRMLPPTQPLPMNPISTADFLSTPIEEPPKELKRPKKKMTFPGFKSARGEGPWSREAFDLLESDRPG